MGKFLPISFLLMSFGLSSQSVKKINAMVAELNNSQFIIDHTVKAGFSYQSRAASKLMKNAFKARVQLMQALEDSSKTVMVQLILCHYYFKKATFAGPKIVTEGDAHVNKYFLGEEKGEGLIVSEKKVKGSYVIYATRADIEKVKEFWKKKGL